MRWKYVGTQSLQSLKLRRKKGSSPACHTVLIRPSTPGGEACKRDLRINTDFDFTHLFVRTSWFLMHAVHSLR